MSCCGKARTRMTSLQSDAAPPASFVFEYVGKTSLTVIGPATRTSSLCAPRRARAGRWPRPAVTRDYSGATPGKRINGERCESRIRTLVEKWLRGLACVLSPAKVICQM